MTWLDIGVLLLGLLMLRGFIAVIVATERSVEEDTKFRTAMGDSSDDPQQRSKMFSYFRQRMQRWDREKAALSWIVLIATLIALLTFLG